MITWINPQLKLKVRKHFESIYERSLTDKELDEIAENLIGYMEAVIKFKINYENK